MKPFTNYGDPDTLFVLNDNESLRLSITLVDEVFVVEVFATKIGTKLDEINTSKGEVSAFISGKVVDRA